MSNFDPSRIDSSDNIGEDELQLVELFDSAVFEDNFGSIGLGLNSVNEIALADRVDESADSSINEVFGTSAGENLGGTNSSDLIDALDGNDTIRGFQGNDLILGGAGNDDIRGDLGDDILLGNSGNDVIRGNRGNDIIVGGDGDDTLFGNKDDDLINGQAGNDFLYGGFGADTLFFGADLLGDGSSDTDTIREFTAEDSLDFSDYLAAGGEISFERVNNRFLSIDLSGEDNIYVLGNGSGIDAAEEQLNQIVADSVDTVPGAPVGGAPDAEVPEIVIDEFQGVSIVNEAPTISVIWDNAAQAATADASQGPTASAYHFALLHTAIYDAWSAYDDVAISSTTSNDDLQRPAEENTDANKVEAVSYAAFRTLSTLLPEQTEIFENVLLELGLDPNNGSIDPTTPAGVGNIVAASLIRSRANDGSNALGDDPNGNGTPFSDTTGYTTPNTPDNVVDIELFTLENTPINNEPLADTTAQAALTPQFGEVTPFALESGDQFRPDGPEPFLVEGVDAEVDLQAGTITLSDESVLDISRDLIGEIINPGFIAQSEAIVDASANLTDEQRLIAEFWEDGPGTSFPPGNGLAFGQFVSARDNNTLDEDVQLFFGLGNSQLDSAIAAWDSKYVFNYARPLRVIRELGRQGLIGEFNEELGGFAIDAYAGPGLGTQTILAEDFITYQFGPLDASPPFPEYVSGHSTFSAAAAEVLQLFTGSDDFGGSVSFEPGSSRFEPGITPVETVTLEWETFTDFADESGLSRIFGGIHFEDGDLDGRQLGRDVGLATFERAQFFINGGVEPVSEF